MHLNNLKKNKNKKTEIRVFMTVKKFRSTLIVLWKSGFPPNTSCKIEFYVNVNYEDCTVHVSNKHDNILELDPNLTKVGHKSLSIRYPHRQKFVWWRICEKVKRVRGQERGEFQKHLTWPVSQWTDEPCAAPLGRWGPPIWDSGSYHHLHDPLLDLKVDSTLIHFTRKHTKWFLGGQQC